MSHSYSAPSPAPVHTEAVAAPATDEQSTLGNAFLAEQMAATAESTTASGELDVGPEDKAWYGVVQNDALDPSWAEKAASLGVGGVKVRLKDTDTLVPGDPMYDFIVACRARGLEVTVLFNNESVGTDYVEPDLARCQERAREAVDKLQGLVSAWEVWNEPQSIEPERDMQASTLMELLGSVYAIFHETGAPVLAAPEWTTGQGDAFRQEMADWWRENRWMYPDVRQDWPFDAMAVHAYFLDGWHPEAMIDTSMAHIADTFGADMPVWVTEFGYPANDEIGYDGQSAFVERVSAAFAGHESVDRMFWYSLRDYPGEESGADMGLFREDGTAKPAAGVWGWREPAPETAPSASGPFTIPRADLEASFLDWLDATGASGEITAEKWTEWYAAYRANGGS